MTRRTDESARAAKTARALDEAGLLPQALPVKTAEDWSPRRLARASALYRGVPRHLQGRGDCPWCAEEGTGPYHLSVRALCRSRARTRPGGG